MYIAHINSMAIGRKVIFFHLNIPSGEKIPRINSEVYASSDNGRSGIVYKIVDIMQVTRYHANKLTGSFACIDYKAVKG